MNKVICNICGTSYPENASQCPICGFARSAEPIDSAAEGNGNYQYVKGGRFSKSNVKKRNHAQQKKSKLAVADHPVKAKPASHKGNGFMAVIIVILLLAIIAVVGYIALRFFLPNDYIFEGLDNLKLPFGSQQAEETPEDPADPQVQEEDSIASITCTGISLDKTELAFEGIDSTYQLNVQVEPANTPDAISYVSSDPSICTVSDGGLITAVGEGSAVITVACGSISTQCIVSCTIPEPEDQITLNRKEITFTAVDESWVIYDGEVPVSEITWTSDNTNVATITEGKVVAVSDGDTTVYATYGSQTVSCLIHCNFADNNVTSGNVSEAGEDDKKYSLYNPTGLSEDVTINVGGKFTLMLVDEDKNEVTDAQWEVNKENVCSYKDGTVKALAVGTAKVTATYKGETYTSIVRVVD